MEYKTYYIYHKESVEERWLNGASSSRSNLPLGTTVGVLLLSFPVLMRNFQRHLNVRKKEKKTWDNFARLSI